MVFPIKRRTGHPGSWNHLYLLFHLKHHSRWLEKRRKGGAYYSQPDLEPSSRSCRKSLTFGWGSCIPDHGSSLSNTYIPKCMAPVSWWAALQRRKENPVPVLKAMMIIGMLSILASGLGRCAFFLFLNFFLVYYF